MRFGQFVFVSITALISVAANAETVDVTSKNGKENSALVYGLYRPLDGGTGKIEGSEDQGDKRGGNGSIVMSLEKCTTGEGQKCLVHGLRLLMILAKKQRLN